VSADSPYTNPYTWDSVSRQIADDIAKLLNPAERQGQSQTDEGKEESEQPSDVPIPSR
jgi:hypothetical protein